MRKIIAMSVLITALSFSGIYFVDTSNAAPKEANDTGGKSGPVQFMGPEFTRMLCDAWNSSQLTTKLATVEAGGNGWIIERNKYMNDISRNKQVMIISRRDCPAIPKVQLTIENKDGKAMCTYGGAQLEPYHNAEWAFAPETHHWYRFASGKWGIFEMPKIMSGFRGIYDVAARNMGNFGLFWKITGSLAKAKNADYKIGCPSLKEEDIKDIEEYIKKIN